jgi:hypothetical protein
MDSNDEVVENPQETQEKPFSAERTRPQLIYDIVFGIIAPIFCFWFDPIVFQDWLFSSGGGQGILARYKLLVYLFSAIAICTLGLWLRFETQLKKQSGMIAGVFFTGALFTSVLSLVLAPFSVAGIFVYGIGILGFIPFFTSYVYWRNGFRALKQAKASLSRQKRVWSIISGIVLLIAIPSGVDTALFRLASESLRVALSGTADAVLKEKATARLKYLKWYIDANEIVDAYQTETDSIRKDKLAAIYQSLRNQDIGERIAFRNDAD